MAKHEDTLKANAAQVRVKPLEWRVPKEDSPKDPPAEDIALCADGIGGIYGISRKQSVGPERLVWWVDDPFTWTGYASIAEAKAAAQTDHEARILAALSPVEQAPQPVAPETHSERPFSDVVGFGSSYQRQDNEWVIYTMPGAKRIGSIEGYDKARLDWIVEALRAALAAEGSAE